MIDVDEDDNGIVDFVDDHNGNDIGNKDTNAQ